MIQIASYRDWDLTQRLQKTLQEQVKFVDISCEEISKQCFPVRIVKKFMHFLVSIRNHKYVMLYAFPKMYAYIIMAKMMHKKVIIYWIGTDVYLLKNNPNRYLIKKGDINLAHSQSLHEELLEFGIQTDILSILPQNIDLSIGKMPERHAVLFYIPEGREDFYGYDWIKTIIECFPDLTFHIVANGNKKIFPQKNVVVHGMISFEEMKKLYDEISIVLRFPKHDSLSISIMEAMFKAKIIIYKYEQEATIRATTVDEFIDRISEQIQKEPAPVLKAREYALRHFTEETAKKQFSKIVHKYQMNE